MTVGELLDLLEGVSPDTEIRLAHQPRYPFEYTIGEVAEVETRDGTVIYIGEGEQLGYPSGKGSCELGW
ncbi:hypothetical protein [Caballeronia sp. INSB1]|jgi:hypothetical protein|uniref:hypothetical protein n=1 Tax=Caballeronia sp. INSB1 TaxID=2921751 RepID=UPI002032FCD0|nr:hypothetical protein [Caballeronia sp. INSB1]